eukprot:jgi/Mesvir1/14460/Mv05172-RA.1
MNRPGSDTDGAEYKNAAEMWLTETGDPAGAGEVDKKVDWYRKGVSYWENVPSTVDGVLGGFGTLSEPDVTESDIFLQEVYLQSLPHDIGPGKRDRVALDCGAGIGRVTQQFLLHRFAEVDLVEPVAHFLKAAEASLRPQTDAESPASAAATPGSKKAWPKGHRAVNFFCKPLQGFTPERGRYDVIWIQWCMGHLTDSDFVGFLTRCIGGLKEGGMIIMKENNAKEGFIVDKDDSSITRSDAYFRDLFKQTPLKLVRSKVQRDFPKNLFTVRMYALQPAGPSPSAPPTSAP